MAAQLLLGRYTGYRLTELFRFDDLIHGGGAGASRARVGPTGETAVPKSSMPGGS